MQQFFPRTLNSFVTVAIFIVLSLDVFLFSNKNDGDFLNSVCVSDSVVFFEMGALMYVFQDRGHVV
jgi:hypothetical protein